MVTENNIYKSNLLYYLDICSIIVILLAIQYLYVSEKKEVNFNKRL